MNIHNILEEVVIQKVNALYEKVKSMKTTWLTCDCEQCRIDTVTYVLNRIPPHYIVSGRGITHSTANQNSQLLIDIETLTLEGMKIVAASKRSYHGNQHIIPEISMKGSFFNFPSFIGNISDGLTFEPVEGVKVTLLQDNVPVTMMDHTWANPVVTSLVTKGCYSFWAKPIKASKTGQQKTFTFTIKATAHQYEETSYAFSVPVVSSEIAELTYNTTYSLKLQNLCLFPEKS